MSRDTKILNDLKKEMKGSIKQIENGKHFETVELLYELIHTIDVGRGLVKVVDPSDSNLDYEVPVFNPSVISEGNNNA